MVAPYACVVIEAFKLEILLSLRDKVKVHCSSILVMANICTNKHDPKVKTVRLNDQITEVKQPRAKANSKMGDHLGSIHFVFFRLADIFY